jgi:hypothetical protein
METIKFLSLILGVIRFKIDILDKVEAIHGAMFSNTERCLIVIIKRATHSVRTRIIKSTFSQVVVVES